MARPSKHAQLTDAQKLAYALLLYARGSKWSYDDTAEWEALTGSKSATMQTLCSLARTVAGPGAKEFAPIFRPSRHSG